MTTLDWRKALDNLEGDEDILRDLAQVFLDQADTMTAEIGRAVEKQNAETLRRSAHTLKGALKVFWAEPATSTALELENQGREGKLTNSEAVYARLQKEVEQLCGDLREALQ